MRIIILSLFCLTIYSCSPSLETTYSKATLSVTKAGSVSDIVSPESVEDWSSRVITILNEEKIDIIEFWLDDSEKEPSMCGCWSCTVSGYQLKVTTTARPERMRELGFE